MPIASIPSPSSSGLHIGSFELHVYGLMYVFAVIAAVVITSRRWRAYGGDPELPQRVALIAFPCGLIGARIYFLITSYNQWTHDFVGAISVWDGGLGVWGGVAGGLLGGLWVLRRYDVDIPAFMDATAPGLLVAQGIGRIGNYFNQELFGGPTNLPWALEISPAHRPPGFENDPTFQPTFLYELVWDFLYASILASFGVARRIRPPGIFALYVAGYSGFRIFEESLRVDPSHYYLGQRLNFWVACVLTAVALLWFARIQFGDRRRAGIRPSME
jgi:prolipoprotein diacylglyceryl transferase